MAEPHPVKLSVPNALINQPPKCRYATIMCHNSTMAAECCYAVIKLYSIAPLFLLAQKQYDQLLAIEIDANKFLVISLHGYYYASRCNQRELCSDYLSGSGKMWVGF